ncbi:hypothetical protein FACS189413_07740 [Bacteroidia bacterium]|nr:hypothetical protein FACS189413_07740 [Bacteroidia bacterium]
MSLIELEQSLPIRFEFIIFDACLMGGIEVAYQLRKKANYIVVSPTETLVAGFPYTQTIPLLFTQTINYLGIAKTFTDYYENQTKDYLKSAALTVINTEKLETFANLLYQSIENKIITISDNAYNLLAYEFSNPIIYYDFFNFLQQTIDDKNRLNQLTRLYSEIVISYEHTNFFLNDLVLTGTTALNFFVFPFYEDNLLQAYMQTDWYVDTNFISCRVK